MEKPLDSGHYHNKQLLLATLFLAPTEYWPKDSPLYGENTKILRENVPFETSE